MAKIPISLGGGGGSGSDDVTASKAQVLAGYTAITSDSDDDPIEGTMTNNGAVTRSLDCGASYTIPAGYHNGSGKVTANSLSSQTSGTATASQILSGYTAYVNGSKVTGSISSMSGGTYTPSTSQQTVSCSGKYMTSNVVISAIPSNYININTNQTVFHNGEYGNICNQGAICGYTVWYGYYIGVISAGSYSPSIRTVNGYTGMYFYVGDSNTGDRRYDGVVFKGSIDLSNFKTLTATFNASLEGSYYWEARLCVVDTGNTTRLAYIDASSYSSVTQRTLTLDISGVNQQAFVTFSCRYNVTVNGTTFLLTDVTLQP